MKKLAFLILSLCILHSSAFAQSEVTEYRPGVTADGVTYFLPQTHLHVTIEAERTVITPGDYAAYAAHYLRLTDVPQEASEKWQIKSLTVTPYGVPDKTQAYTIRLKQRTTMPYVTLTPEGILLAVNTEAEQPDELNQPSVVNQPSKTYNTADYLTPEILAATNQRKAAELTAAEIYDIRENRVMLNKGQADFMPKDGVQLRLMLEGLDAQEAALLQLFKGTTETSTHTFTVDFTPYYFDGRQEVLFRFSPRYGLCQADDLSGEPYHITLTDEGTLPPLDPKAKTVRRVIEDLRYNVCSTAKVKVTNPMGDLLYGATLPFSQIGRVEHLGGDLFNKKAATQVWMDPTTGGILRIDSETGK